MPREIDCSCGHHIRIPDDWDVASTTCPNCGGMVAVAETQPQAAKLAKLCPVCAKKLLPHENWCTRCKAPLKDLLKLRSDPVQSAQTGLCPACGNKLLPKETACRKCHVVVKDFLEQLSAGNDSPQSRLCRTCGTRLLPKETACPQCKAPVQAAES